MLSRWCHLNIIYYISPLSWDSNPVPLTKQKALLFLLQWSTLGGKTGTCSLYWWHLVLTPLALWQGSRTGKILWIYGYKSTPYFKPTFNLWKSHAIEMGSSYFLCMLYVKLYPWRVLSILKMHVIIIRTVYLTEHTSCEYIFVVHSSPT